ncbi:MAG: hypothetical protein EOM55_03975 [Clostridia bacterium]|nr:hypothetical protein [Clostridia bacterium]
MDDNSFMISASTIGYVLLGFVLFFLVVSALVGFKRGFKKSLFRFVWVAVTVAILIFVTPLVSNWLNKFDLSSYGLNIFGEVNNLSDIGVNLFKEVGLQEYMNNSPALLDFAGNMSVALLNVILFILLFWLTKWILGIPYAIIASKIFDKDVKQMKKYKQKVKSLKKKGSEIDETSDETPSILTATNKYRGVGMIFGFMLGLLICAATLFPIVGINSIYQEVYASVTTTNEENEEVPFLSTVLDEESSAYINCYEDSIASKIMTYSGMSFLSNFIFDSMAKVEVGGQSVSLTNEVKVGVRVFKKVMEIQSLVENFEDVTQDSLERALAQIKEIFLIIEDSNALYLFGDELLPYLIETKFIDNDEITIDFGGENYAQMLKEAYQNYQSSNIVNVASLKAQVEAFFDIAILLNSNGLVEPLMNNEISEVTDIASLLSTSIVNSATFTQSLVNYFYDVTMFKYKYPELVDSLLSTVFEEIGIEGFESNLDAISDTTLKASLIKLIENSINLVKSYNDSEDFDFGTQAKTMATFGYLGDIFDTCKNDLLSSASYTALVQFLQDKIIEQTTEFTDLSTVINELENIVSWRTELRGFAPLYTTIIKIVNKNENVNGLEYSTTFDIDNIFSEEFEQLNDIGSALQQVIASTNSKLVTNKNIRSIVSSLLGTIDEEDSINEYLDIMVGDKTLKNFILDNIWNSTTESSSIEDWGNEMRYTLKVVRKINSTFIELDSARISQEDNTELAELGKAIDEAIANTDLVISNKVLRALVEFFLNDKMAEETFPAELESLLTMDYNNGTATITVKNGILNNIFYNGSSNITSWENEFDMLKSLFATDFENGTDVELYSNIGEALDSLAHSKMFERSIVRQIVLHYIDTQTEDLDAGLKTGPLASIRNIINADQKYTTGENEGEYQIKFADELTYLLDLVETATATYSANGTESAERVKFYAIGDELDTLLVVNAGVVTEYKSKLLTQTVINQFLAYYIKSFNVENTVEDYESLNAIIQGIPGEGNVNLLGISNYRLEFELLLNTVDIMKDSTATLEDIGITLNDVRKRNSHFITDSVIDQLVVLFIDSKVDVGWTEANDIITLIKTNITTKELNANIDDYKKMFAELSSLKDYFTSLQSVSDKDDLTGVGEDIDDVRNMTIAGDKYVARALAVLIIDKAKEYIGDEAAAIDGLSEDYGKALVQNILVNDPYKFPTFDVDGTEYIGTHPATNYYKDLFNEIANITVPTP